MFHTFTTRNNTMRYRSASATSLKSVTHTIVSKNLPSASISWNVSLALRHNQWKTWRNYKCKFNGDFIRMSRTRKKKKENRKHFREYFAYRSIHHATLEIHEFIDHSLHAKRVLFGYFYFKYSWTFLKIIRWTIGLLDRNHIVNTFPFLILNFNYSSHCLCQFFVFEAALSKHCRWPEKRWSANMCRRTLKTLFFTFSRLSEEKITELDILTYNKNDYDWLVWFGWGKNSTLTTIFFKGSLKSSVTCYYV